VDLTDFFAKHTRVAVAFSGGVDSAYLLYSAKRAGAEVCAYYVKSAFQPGFELEDAVRLAGGLHADLKIVRADVLGVPEIAANASDRCYHCKKCMLTAVMREAVRDGFQTLLDGTNASDDVDDRPGMRAVRELGVLSPLRECGVTKAGIRRLSREAGLFTHDKPAYACLATRIPTGEAITAAALEKTEKAEAYLFSLGFTDFRIRMLDGMARIQVPQAQAARLMEDRARIVGELGKYYRGVLLDLAVQR